MSGEGETIQPRYVKRVSIASTVKVLTRIAVPAALAASAAVTAAPPSSPVSQASLQAEASSLATEIMSQSTELHTLAVQIGQAQASYSQAQAQVQAYQTLVGAAEVTYTGDRSRLAQSAVAVFIQRSSYSPVVDYLNSPLATDALRQDYQSFASMSIQSEITAYRKAREQLLQAQAALLSKEGMAKANLDQLNQEQNSINTQVANEESTLGQIKGQIAQLVQQALAAKNSQPQGLPQGGGIGAALNIVTHSPSGSAPGPASPSQLLALRECESGNNYQENTGNGYYGAYQFSESTWLGLGFGGYPNQALPSTQDQAAQTLLARSGWGQWPACSAMLGF